MRKKFNKKLLIIFLLLLISIGFAYLTTTLNINGAVGFNSNTFDVHFDNIELVSEEVGYTTLEIDSNDDTKINTAINFKEPSEIFEYTVDVVNAGGIDAIFDSITSNFTSANEDYISIDIKYFDGSTINQNDLLRMGQSKKIRVKIIYNLDIDELPSINTTSITTTVSYKNINVRDVTYNRKVWNIDYDGGYEHLFIVPKTGTYKLEVWGGQGGTYNTDSLGGYGGYATGTLSLTKDTTLYVNVGGAGTYDGADNVFISGGYNGGGNANGFKDKYAGSGGGATHIALDSGLLNTFSSKVNRLIIVAGGGGGGVYTFGVNTLPHGTGGAGGGYIGNTGTVVNATQTLGAGGTQSAGGTGMRVGTFGKGANTYDNGCGGGGGYYGGGAGFHDGGCGGGSGYIGYSSLSDKIMYCSNCQSSESESDESSIKTRSTTNVSETPTSTYTKIGNGYTRITLIN